MTVPPGLALAANGSTVPSAQLLISSVHVRAPRRRTAATASDFPASSQGAGPGPGSDHYARFPRGALVDWQERDGHDFSLIGTEGVQDTCELSAPSRGASWQSGGLVDTSFMQRCL